MQNPLSNRDLNEFAQTQFTKFYGITGTYPYLGFSIP